MRINKMITKRKIFDLLPILSTDSSRKCMEISLENLYVNIGTLRVKDPQNARGYVTQSLYSVITSLIARTLVLLLEVDKLSLFFFPSDDFVGLVVVVSSETTLNCYDIASEVLQERNTKAISTTLKLTEMISEACMTFLNQTLCGITDLRRTQSETTTKNEQDSSFKITLKH